MGDRDLQINEQPVVTRDAVREAMSDIPLDRTLRLTVGRDGRHFPLTFLGPEERPESLTSSRRAGYFASGLTSPRIKA